MRPACCYSSFILLELLTHNVTKHSHWKYLLHSQKMKWHVLNNIIIIKKIKIRMWNSNLIQRPLFVADVSIVSSNLHGNDILGFVPESLLLSGIIQMVVVHATRSQGCMGSLSCAVWADSYVCMYVQGVSKNSEIIRNCSKKAAWLAQKC